MSKSIVAPHDPAWRASFAQEAAAIRQALGDALISVEHIGSTAVPLILAKPIVDMLGIAVSLAAIDASAPPPGYEALGSYGLDGRRYFRKSDAAGVRTHHLHVYAAGDPAIERHLAFRDYLIAHPAIAAEYSALKASCVGAADYQELKSPFVVATQAAALAWYRERPAARA